MDFAQLFNTGGPFLVVLAPIISVLVWIMRWIVRNQSKMQQQLVDQQDKMQQHLMKDNELTRERFTKVIEDRDKMHEEQAKQFERVLNAVVEHSDANLRTIIEECEKERVQFKQFMEKSLQIAELLAARIESLSTRFAEFEHTLILKINNLRARADFGDKRDETAALRERIADLEGRPRV